MRKPIEALRAELVPSEPHTTAGLVSAVYEELRRLAYRQLTREPHALTLQPTALVHEAYLRLCAEGEHRWANRAQFFRAAAVAMRRILMDGARRKHALRHGGALSREALDAEAVQAAEAAPGLDLLALEIALERLKALDPELFELVELRYFAGLTIEETAAVLGLSPRSVRRDWETARLFLFERLRRAGAAGSARAT
jgi:RNA polymerase sigma factor (TIGR02999 family)